MSETRQMYIGGAWSGATGGATFKDYNPANGEVWAQVADGSRADAKRAIDAASEALPAWRRLAPHVRAGYLLKVADILERRQKEIADLTAKVGQCAAPKNFDSVENWLRGVWTMKCERGDVRAEITLAPTMPPRVQHLELSTVQGAPQPPASSACRIQ